MSDNTKIDHVSSDIAMLWFNFILIKGGDTAEEDKMISIRTSTVFCLAE